MKVSDDEDHDAMMVVVGRNQMMVVVGRIRMMVVVDRNRMQVHDDEDHDVMVVVDSNPWQVHNVDEGHDDDDVDLLEKLMEVVDIFHRVLDILLVRIHCVHVEEVVGMFHQVVHVLYYGDDEMG